MNTETFASRLRALRARRGVKQKDLARRVGISPAYLCVIEQGKATPSLSVLAKLAKELGAEVDVTFSEKETTNG